MTWPSAGFLEVGLSVATHYPPAQRKGNRRDDDHRCRPAQEHPHGNRDRPADEPGGGSIRIHASLADYRRLLKWARQFDQRRWAVENAEGLGRHLSSWLLARGEQVVDIPSTATARVRQLSRGGGRKNDQIDAAAAACAAALQGDGRALQAEGITDALALLDESRTNLTQSRVRLVNQLHALLRDLLAGGAPTDLSATTAAALLRRVRPRRRRTSPQADRRRPGQPDPLGRLPTQIQREQISELVAASGSTLTEHRRHRRDHRRPSDRAHRSGQQVPQLGRVRHLCRCGARSRSPAPTRLDTASPEAATANSTPRCTPSPSPRSEHPAAAATPTTPPNSPRVRLLAKRDGA